MARNIVKALDIGTQNIKAVTAEIQPAGETLRILGAAMVPTEGVRRGAVLHPESLVPKVKEAVREVERSSGIPFKNPYLSFGSWALGFQRSRSRVSVSTGSGEITSYDVDRALKQARPQRHAMLNKEILESYPLNFTIDSELNLKDPVGAKGENLEAEVLFVTALEKPLAALLGAAEEAGLAIEDVRPAPLAAARSLLPAKLAEVGAVAVDIGAETMSLAVFEENLPYSLAVFPLGSAHITNDLALGFQISIAEAERLKLSGVLPDDSAAARRKFQNVVEARLEDMFELVEGHLKKAGRAGLLPGGAILGGGGARIAGIVEHAKNNLKLPADLGKCQGLEASHKLRDPVWAVAVGLCLLVADEEKTPASPFKKPSVLRQKISSWFKSLIP